MAAMRNQNVWPHGRRLLGLGFISALGLCLPLACGGDSSEPRPSPTEESPDGVDPFSCEADDDLELLYVQDFEKGIATNFYVNADGTEGSEVHPPLGTSSPGATEIEGGRCGSSLRGFRMTGEGLRIWGMVFGFNYFDGTRDLSEWEGVSFWARRGSGDSGRSLFFSVFDPLTENRGGCCDSDSEVLSEKCDAYGTGVGLDEEWRHFAIPFSALRQRGFGVATDGLLTSRIVGFNWAADRGNWDVWIDDIALYRSPDWSGSGAGGAGSELPECLEDEYRAPGLPVTARSNDQ